MHVFSDEMNYDTILYKQNKNRRKVDGELLPYYFMTDVKCRFQKSLPNLIMEKFNYRIKNENGLHARPAVQFVNMSEKFKSNITLTNNSKCASGKGLFAVMGLGIKCGDNIEIECNGPDEAEARKALEKFLKNNL